MEKEEQISKLNDSIEKTTNQIVAAAVSQVDEYPKEQFLSFEHRKEKAAINQKQFLDDFNSLLEKGLGAILAVLEKQDPSQAEKLVSWLTNHIETVATMNDNDQFLKELAFPLELLELMYEASLFLLNNNEIDEAHAAISVCLLFSQTHDKIWFTFGDILERKREYEKALYAFQMAIVLNQKNPFSHSHQARLFALLEIWEPALESIEKVSQLVVGREMEYRELIDYCHLLMQAIESKREKKAV